MAEVSYYPFCVRIGGQKLYAIWFSNGYQGIHLTKRGMIPAFRRISDLSDYAKNHGIELINEEPGVNDLDVVSGWLNNPSIDNVDCEEMLNAWNLFGDLHSAIERRNTDHEDVNHLTAYGKLFAGCNLPAMTPPDTSYVPKWTSADVAELKAALEPGLELFRSRLSIL